MVIKEVLGEDCYNLFAEGLALAIESSVRDNNLNVLDLDWFNSDLVNYVECGI